MHHMLNPGMEAMGGVSCDNNRMLIWAWEKNFQISQELRKHRYKCKIILRKISFSEIWSFWSWFSQACTRNVFVVISYNVLHYFIALEKGKTECNIIEIIWHKVFAHWKLKLLNFLMDSVLIVWPLYFHIPIVNQSTIFCRAEGGLLEKRQYG